MSRPNLTVAIAENERVLSSMMDAFSRYGVTDWSELNPQTTTFCSGPPQPENRRSTHSFRAGPINQAEWATIQTDLVETAAGQGFTQVVVLQDTEKFRTLDIWGPYDAVLHITAGPEHTAVGIESGCHPLETAPDSE